MNNIHLDILKQIDVLTTLHREWIMTLHQPTGPKSDLTRKTAREAMTIALNDLARLRYLAEQSLPKACEPNPTPEPTTTKPPLGWRRFPEKGQLMRNDPDECRLAHDLLSCDTLEEAHSLARRVLQEWSYFWKTC